MPRTRIEASAGVRSSSSRPRASCASRSMPLFAPESRRAWLCALCALVACGAGATEADRARSRLGFAASQMEVELDGEFKRFAATVDFDRAAPAAGKVVVDIDMAGIDAGSKDANELLQGRDFFDIAHYPKA